MPADTLRDQLQFALGDAYTLERELGGGGMSRVFFARERALGRDVVIKVLHPELASGVNIDRFRREIQLAAQLQHPHIVPILVAGEMDGLPFLTMPFVAGRSLRERLVSEGALPIDDALSILRDVARALAYAHGRGVIHRDIKPDNVLLAEGSATVTDFGVAKAVSAARTGAMATLTSAGVSIGTPMYMAPEQAAGDPDVDARADIYAWGVMAFELLAGRPPFVANTPYMMILSHLSETPPPVTDYRPDCPPVIAALIARCLAKSPDDRPQYANELRAALSDMGTPSTGVHVTRLRDAGPPTATLAKALGLYALTFVAVAALARGAVTMLGLPDWAFTGTLIVMGLGLPLVVFTGMVNRRSRAARMVPSLTPGGSSNLRTPMARLALRFSPHVSWRRTWLGGVGAIGVFVLVVAGFMTLRALGIGPDGSLLAKGVISDREQVLVTDFTAESDTSLGGVVSEAVRTNLAQSHAVTVVPTSRVAAALQRMQQPATTRIDLPLARALGQREGIGAIVDGQIRSLQSGYIVKISLLAAESGDVLATFPEFAKDPGDLIPAIDRVTRKMRERLGESLKTIRAGASLERVTTTSLPALRAYTAGMRANILEQNYPKAIAALDEAIKLDTNFAAAYRLESLVYVSAGLDPNRADSLRSRAFRLRDRLPDLERALVEATYYNAGSHADRSKAIAADTRALEVDPTSGSALNGLGLLYTSRREYARAESLYRRGQKVSASSFFYSNLIPPLVSEGKFDEALHTIAELVRRNPAAAGSAPGMALSVWAARGRLDSASAMCSRLAHGSSAYWRGYGHDCLSTIARTEGRLRESLQETQASIREDSLGGKPPLPATFVIRAAELDARVRDRPADAVRRLDSLLASTSIKSYPREQQFYFGAIDNYAAAGRADRAKAILAQYDAEVRDTSRLRLEGRYRHTAVAEIATAEGNYPLAIREFWAGDSLYDRGPTDCSACVLPAVARAYDLAGKHDDAIRVLEQYVTTPDAFRFAYVDPIYLARSYKRLGELYEAKGDKDKATTYFTKFADLWKNADPELQPQVAEAKKYLAANTAAAGHAAAKQ